ncbi:hypothetical protein KUF71_017355 [Frankliniella fusca]|uniref:RNA-directed DNA polymerase n=1 Tax=Frankliniella fusca TaxID=407009 RepID=A0AAE1LX35_9NEOP|nr:hypothetical protein KUF71_017355 [Frankliniella fusca]
MTLSAYEMEVKYRPGEKHGNADALSRLPVPGPTEDPPAPPILYVNFIDTDGQRRPEGPVVTAALIAEETGKDPLLRQVREWAREGWPRQQPQGEAGEFWKKRDQISVVGDCVLWGERVCVPAALRPDALARLHSSHQGIVRSKRMARCVLWWPYLNEQIEALVNSCQVCQANRPAPPAPAYKPWPRDRRWGRVHLDFGEPSRGEVFLVAVDAETGWMEAWWVPGPSTASVIRCLREAFARLGDPDLMVSDNGTAFKSEELRAFLDARGIKHLTIAVYCAWSNGLAERAVRTIKEGLPKFEGTAAERLLAVLAAARFTPGDDGLSPAQRLRGWQPVGQLDRMRPDPPKREGERAGKGKQEAPKFQVGQAVWVRRLGRKGTEKWMRARAERSRGARLWDCVCEDGTNVKRHVAQMRRRSDGRQPGKPIGYLPEQDEAYLNPPPTPRPWESAPDPPRRVQETSARDETGDELVERLRQLTLRLGRARVKGEKRAATAQQLLVKLEEAQALAEEVGPVGADGLLDLDASDLGSEEEEQLLEEGAGSREAAPPAAAPAGGGSREAATPPRGGQDGARAGESGGAGSGATQTPRQGARPRVRSVICSAGGTSSSWADECSTPSPAPRAAPPKPRPDARQVLEARRRQEPLPAPAAAAASKTQKRRERRRALQARLGADYQPKRALPVQSAPQGAQGCGFGGAGTRPCCSAQAGVGV